jgi:hypothetical protein
MKKILLLVILAVFSCSPILAQLEDRFSYLTDDEVSKYAQPLVTTLGTSLNSASYMSASIPKTFGFTFSLKAMAVLVPKDQQTFTPTLPDGYTVNKETATIYGDKGGYYSGKNGYYVYPPGINSTTIPMAFPQITCGIAGTEFLLRFLPSIPVGEKKLNFITVGLKHNLNRYLFISPVDIAVQVFYSQLTISDMIKSKNFAINAEASKTFGILTVYGGMQYEKSTLDLDYTITGDEFSANPDLQQDRKVSVSITGKNNFRVTAGCAVKLSVLILNADYSLSNQSVFTTGLSFAF